MTSPLHHPDRPAWMPIIGLTPSEQDRDFWDNLDSRTTLRGATDDLDLFPASENDQCLKLLPGRADCSRRDGHPGRHLAILDQPHGKRAVCSAWPGTHCPCPADLED